jgi:hypothetical protein
MLAASCPCSCSPCTASSPCFASPAPPSSSPPPIQVSRAPESPNPFLLSRRVAAMECWIGRVSFRPSLPAFACAETATRGPPPPPPPPRAGARGGGGGGGPSPPPPPLPAERVDRREDLEALKTHLPSNQNSLEAREETRSVASLPCSAFISGELLIGLAGGSAW